MAIHKENIQGNDIASRIKEELKELEKTEVEANGVRMKASQCYHFETDPPHVLFNTNCPSSLKEQIQTILSRHIHRT